MVHRTVAETCVDILVKAGMDTVFGLPGGENVELLEALRKAEVRFVLVRNESSAVFMADVYSRLTGRLGVCLTTLGPGATNAFVGLAHADLDRAPVLLLTAETNQQYLPGHTHQVYNLQSLFEPICKLTVSLTAKNVVSATHNALARMNEGRPGPVHLSLSREMASRAVVPTPFEVPSRSASMSETQLVTAKRALVNSKKPLIIVGLGLEPQKPYKALQTLAERLDAPVIVTPKAKGALSDKHPLSAGTIGLTRTDPVYDLINEADLILAIGFDVVELVKPWDEKAELLWIAAWENRDPKLPAVASLDKDISFGLAALGQATKSNASWGRQRVQAFRDEHANVALAPSSKGRILPQQFLNVARTVLSEDILITTDVGSHKIFFALNWKAYVPNRYMLSNGLSAMGFGLSAAIAGAIALEQPVVCITGDAGFSMVMGELGIIRELNLPVIIVVMNDAALDLIRSAQRRAGKDSFGTEFLNPNFSCIAKAYDLAYYLIDSEQSAADNFKEAFAKGEACLIEVLVDPKGYPTTPVER